MSSLTLVQGIEFSIEYDEDEWKRIGRVLMENSSLIPWFDRLQLLESLRNSLRRKEIKPYVIPCIGEYIQNEDNPDIVKEWIDVIDNVLRIIRPTKNWTKFKQYYITWMGWIEQQFCKPDAKGRIDCTCYKAKNKKKTLLNDRMKEHCKFKEKTCKKYCLKYCDHFIGESMYGHQTYDCGVADDGMNLNPSHKDVEEYLDNFTSGKMCLS